MRLPKTLSHHGTVVTHKFLPFLVSLFDAGSFRVHHVLAVCLPKPLSRVSLPSIQRAHEGGT